MGAITLHNPPPDKFVKDLFSSVDSLNDTNCNRKAGRPE